MSDERKAYGIAEIAEVLDAHRPRVSSWASAGDHGMPSPDFNLRCGPVWLAETIEPWLAAMAVERSAREEAA